MSKPMQTIFIEDHNDKQSFDEKLDKSFDEKQEGIDNNDNQQGQHNFDDDGLQHLLDGEQGTKQQMMLRFKVQQLQKICNSLSETNRKLINKITLMEEQREERETQLKMKQQQQEQNDEDDIFVDQYSQLNNQFTEVEQLINQYRGSLDHFKETVMADLKAKDQAQQDLNQQIKFLKDRINQLQSQKQQILKANKQIQTRNQGLILQIQNLQKNKIKLQQRLSVKQNIYPQQLRYDNSFADDDLSTQMQTELESIINKLVKQLEYERGIRKKMNDQMKRMSNELMESQKQIMQKNRKLYDLQMKILKNNKSAANTDTSSGSSRFRPKFDEQKTQRPQKQSPKINLKNFPLLQLINGELDQPVSQYERKTIGIKILELYERKLDKQDYSALMPQNLLVNNFNHKRPELISIRKTGNTFQQGEKSQQSLIWNLAFVLDNLYGQVSEYEDTGFSEILEVTGNMLEKQMDNSRQDLRLLRNALNE